jgi:hypothetical protein
MQLILNFLVSTTLFAVLTPLVQYFCKRKLVCIDPQNGRAIFIIQAKCYSLHVYYLNVNF